MRLDEIIVENGNKETKELYLNEGIRISRTMVDYTHFGQCEKRQTILKFNEAMNVQEGDDAEEGITQEFPCYKLYADDQIELINNGSNEVLEKKKTLRNYIRTKSHNKNYN